MFWTRKHHIESSNHEGFFKNFPCCRQFLQEFYKVQTNFVGFFHARCLNFPCFINYLAACMHAFCMFYLYVSLGFLYVIYYVSRLSFVLSRTAEGQGLQCYTVKFLYNFINFKAITETKKKKESYCSSRVFFLLKSAG